MPQTASATADTENANRYLQQLCKHWSHKAQAKFSPEAGEIAFESGNTLSMVAHTNHLELQVHVPDEADLKRFQEVVDAHLKRFAFREDLQIIWS
ncbi:DUF2218 domain-containing protein [uncultured Shimia sp.]|uniref:DUF2218 domain-containing protein n=1 Tax=uncultured Shimia sp. TaxID=573152 RepID=UPI002637BDBD|nr:DUF2218 domain-containing protein [uncultured Shimia sp.]